MEEIPADPPPPTTEEKPASVYVTCSREEKGAWVRESRKRGIKLGQLVREIMNAAINKNRER